MSMLPVSTAGLKPWHYSLTVPSNLIASRTRQLSADQREREGRFIKRANEASLRKQDWKTTSNKLALGDTALRAADSQDACPPTIRFSYGTRLTCLLWVVLR
jgi:hypothetical protein